MKLDSPWFDRVRVAPKGPRATTRPKACEHPGCRQAGGFRAPKGRGKEGQYWNFCVDHVREYNRTYNYFVDMPDDAVAAYQRAGFRRIGARRGARISRGQPTDIVLMDAVPRDVAATPAPGRG